MQKNKRKDLYNPLDATITAGECKMTLSFTDFCSENEILFEDLCRETERLFVDIADEHYQSYLVSIEDRDND
jgi:hypothetical protein